MDESEAGCTKCPDDTGTITCPACQGNTCQWCECDKPECEACDNIGTTTCPACYDWR